MLLLDVGALVWLVLAIAAAIIEVLIPHFGLIFVSAGGVGAAVVALLGAGIAAQILTFAAVVGLSLVFLRPRLVSKLGARGVPSRTESLVGRRGQVTQEINPTVGTGRVNVGGEDWAARSTTAIPSGAEVVVAGADGIVLEVRPI